MCPTLCDPMDCSLTGSSVHGDSPGKNTGVACHSLLQGIFPTQGLNQDLLDFRQIPYYLSHQGSPTPQKGGGGGGGKGENPRLLSRFSLTKKNQNVPKLPFSTLHFI